MTSPWATPPAHFVMDFWGRGSWTICLGWLQTAILLIISSEDYRREPLASGRTIPFQSLNYSISQLFLGTTLSKILCTETRAMWSWAPPCQSLTLGDLQTQYILNCWPTLFNYYNQHKLRNSTELDVSTEFSCYFTRDPELPKIFFLCLLAYIFFPKRHILKKSSDNETW
jgi:hypothetical protein